MYIPKTMWKKFEEKLLDELYTMKMGTVENFQNFINAVIDKQAFESISSYIEFARKSSDAKIIAGGGSNSEEGYFIEPTVILTDKPDFKTMVEEVFGPVLTIYLYEPSKFEETLELCDKTSPYALTGSIFARDRYAIDKAIVKLRNAAGNFYINDKPTGAVVGQQPFGGSRASGTNDKAGSAMNLLRWVSMRSIKETLVPPKNYRYPFMD